MKSHLHIYKFISYLFSILLMSSSFTAKGFQTDLVSGPPHLTDTKPVMVNPDSTSNYIESSYPGGKTAWMRHLVHNIRYPQKAMNNDIQGTVIVKFTIDEKGRLKNFEALTGPEELKKESIRVLRAGGKWIPATKNGQVVSSEKDQAITFRKENRETPPVVKPDSMDFMDSRIFSKVEIESTFPGGASAWMRYLGKSFRYPVEAQARMVQGTVVIQFIVDQNGNVSNVEAVSGPMEGGLREEAERVIRGSGKWMPAVQNGRVVKSYKKQAITFRLER